MKKTKRFIPIILGVFIAFIFNTITNDTLGLIQMLIIDIIICLLFQLIFNKVFKWLFIVEEVISVIFLFCITLFVYFLFLVNIIISKKLCKPLDESEYNYETIMEQLRLTVENASNMISFTFGKAYSFSSWFNGNKCTITIKKCNKYTKTDYYCCMHELAHYYDMVHSDIGLLYRLMPLFVLNRIVILPIIIINFIVEFYSQNSLLPNYIFIIIKSLFFIVAVMRIIVIIITELHASKLAIELCEKCAIIRYTREEILVLRKFAILCMLDQLYLALNWVMLVILIGYIIY